MHRQMGRGFAIDFVQETDELLMPVTLGALTQNPPSLDVERGEQGHRTVPGIIVGSRRRLAGDQRQWRLSALQRLKLVFSSTDKTTAWSGGLTSSPTTSRTLSTK